MGFGAQKRLAEAQREKQEQAAKARKDMYEVLFNSDLGQRVLTDICKRGRADATVFNAENERLTAYGQGIQDFVRDIRMKATKVQGPAA